MGGELHQSTESWKFKLTLKTLAGGLSCVSFSFPFSFTLSEVVVPPTEVCGCDVPFVGGMGEPEAVCVRLGFVVLELEGACDMLYELWECQYSFIEI